MHWLWELAVAQEGMQCLQVKEEVKPPAGTVLQCLIADLDSLTDSEEAHKAEEDDANSVSKGNLANLDQDHDPQEVDAAKAESKGDLATSPIHKQDHVTPGTPSCKATAPEANKKLHDFSKSEDSIAAPAHKRQRLIPDGEGASDASDPTTTPSDLTVPDKVWVTYCAPAPCMCTTVWLL